MPPKSPPAQCTGSSKWNSAEYISDTSTQSAAESSLAKDDLRSAITTSFYLSPRDAYVYHAIVSVSLAEVQHVVSLGDANGLHAWYRDTANVNQAEGKPLRPPPPLPSPPPADIEAYISIFLPQTSTPSALKGFASNAKKDSLRAQISSHLLSKRYLHPSLPPAIQNLPRNRSPPPNPYLTFWAWSCRNLAWAGPCAASETTVSSHHILPVFMHHFGCVCPSYESLEILRHLAAGREILDVGSGNGYWTFVLRQHLSAMDPKTPGTVTAVDNAQSAWRATWVPDTVIASGTTYLRKRSGAPDAVLLLVYPIVGGGVAGGEEGGFTRELLREFKGDTLAVVGTQNRNGYTGFRGISMDEWMQKSDEGRGWTKVVQIPLPSFAGKDEAMFIFQRGEQVSKIET